MTNLVSQAAVCFFACHGGPADHFAAFNQSLSPDVRVEIYASGPALAKFNELGVKVSHPFVLPASEKEGQELLDQLVQTCSACSTIITDVGDPLCAKVQTTLAGRVTHLRRLAYYDNFGAYVPGYSETANQVMKAADVVLFANANLVEEPCFREFERIGIGYYPAQLAEVTATRRKNEQTAVRQQFFSQHGLVDEGQEVMVYFGGNNDEYFKEAFPAFLSLVKKAMECVDLSHHIFVIQQHPRAKTGSNADAIQMDEWIIHYGNQQQAPTFVVSKMDSKDVQVMAKAAFYHQTTMAPQFVLAGIPTVQIGKRYEDFLVTNCLIPSVTGAAQLVALLSDLGQKKDIQREAVLKALGIKENWPEILKEAIKISP